MADRLAGRVLNGRYELQSVLGGGGMALVYRALDRVLNRTVAVKVLREQYATDPTFLQRFTREAQAAGALSHPNVVSVYDVGQDGDVPYIVMEYVPGMTLRDMIAQRGPLPVAQAVEIAAQILAALDYAHRNGLVHRDIKPGNVLITPQGTVKVVDFGIAKSANDLSLTGAGLALGTAAYFSPEQARGEGALPQSDLYSVGVTLYEMLTGRTPFQADNDVAMAYQHINAAPVPPRQWNPSIPPQLEQIILRALAKNPAARFGSAGEMEQALRNYAAFGAQATAAVPQMPRPAPVPATVVAPAPRPVYVAPPAPRVAPPVQPVPARVQSYGGGSSWITWVLGLVALLLLLGGAVLILNGNSLSLFTSATATPATGVQPTFVPATLIPEQATATTPPTATPVPASATPLPPSATAIPQVAAPDLTSKTLQDAQNIAASAGLKVEVANQQYDPNHPEGTIIVQEPGSGQPVPVGGTIKVVVSRGPQPLAMPNIVNTDGAQAQQFLNSLHLNVTVQQEQSDTVPQGVVTRQNPDPGTQVKAGDPVTIWISSGPPPAAPTDTPPAPTAPPTTVNVPDVVGMNQKDAVTIVGQAGLVPQVQMVGRGQIPGVSDRIGKGQVAQEQPDAGTAVERGSTVTLVVLR